MALEKPDWPTFFLLPRLIDGSFIGFHEQKKKKKRKNRARFRIIRSNSIIGIQKQGGKLFMPDRSLNSPWPWPLSNYSHSLPPVRLYDCYSVEKENFSIDLYRLKYTYKTRGDNNRTCRKFQLDSTGFVQVEKKKENPSIRSSRFIRNRFIIVAH